MKLKCFESLTSNLLFIKKPLIVYFLLMLLFFASCNDEMDDPPFNNVTYTPTIKAIIGDNCLNCHLNQPVNGASIPLISLENVRDAVKNRDLIGRVESGSMPAVGDVLTAIQVQAIKDWRSGEFQE